ncbi:efflux RND transporter periplasmic adaptor subunit [Catenuloplanes atrovinosus]|uniref:Uncharacterized protein n=1 Tax=Catenuloplanes atrovinosus TaxID=137266 RepID=A0AAE4CAA1_9ACTN|nr:efflux RND transporter periplasmic adaptor subunit [Catenuloplanes atrovinosus]MDR7277406.1 hypothetical protein [Catenuloplanes atrovinosus]
MGRRWLPAVGALMMAVAGCSLPSGEETDTPVLEAPGTVLTTVQATRQDVNNAISLTGKVTIDPVFGIAAPIDGEIRYLDRQPATEPATADLWVASVWKGGEPHEVNIPAGSILAGRLLADGATVTAGMPVVSATRAGYGIVAEIASEHAYRVADTVDTVKAQIKNGPGPFDCKPLGAIAALPAGTIPAAPDPEPDPETTGAPAPEAGPQQQAGGSEATGLRLVCTAPADVKLINGVEVTLELVTGKATNVLVLPVEAVAGTQGKGKVDIVDGEQQRRTVDVVLGLTDGKVVEIKSGLKGDEKIAIPGPNLPEAQQTAGPEVAIPGTPQ